MASIGSEPTEKDFWARVRRNTGTIAFVFGLLATGGMVLLMYWLFHGNGYYGAQVDVQSLNLVGDSLSGFAAWLAVIWLIIAAIMQRHELRLTQQELETTRETLRTTQLETRRQTRLNHNAAQANYQLALFDRRMAIYTGFRSTAYQLFTAGALDNDAQNVFRNAVNNTPYFFGQDVVDRVREMEDHVARHDRYMFRVGRYRGREAEGHLPTPEQEETFQEALTITTEEQDWMFENITPEKLELLFMPHLIVPSSIDLPTDEDLKRAD